MQQDNHGETRWSSRLPGGSVGLALVVSAAGAAWAHENAPKAVAWGLTAAAAAAWVGAIIWCALPLLRLQRDPVLRRMGLTLWPVESARRKSGTMAGEAQLARDSIEWMVMALLYPMVTTAALVLLERPESGVLGVPERIVVFALFGACSARALVSALQLRKLRRARRERQELERS